MSLKVYYTLTDWIFIKSVVYLFRTSYTSQNKDVLFVGNLFFLDQVPYELNITKRNDNCKALCFNMMVK